MISKKIAAHGTGAKHFSKTIYCSLFVIVFVRLNRESTSFWIYNEYTQFKLHFMVQIFC